MGFLLSCFLNTLILHPTFFSLPRFNIPTLSLTICQVLLIQTHRNKHRLGCRSLQLLQTQFLHPPLSRSLHLHQQSNRQHSRNLPPKWRLTALQCSQSRRRLRRKLRRQDRTHRHRLPLRRLPDKRKQLLCPLDLACYLELPWELLLQ